MIELENTEVSGFKDDLAKAYEHGVEDGKPKWIPVSERLPEVGEFVLVASVTNPNIHINLNRIGRDGYWFYMAFGITHWMPLPEPPELVSNPDKLEEER